MRTKFYDWLLTLLKPAIKFFGHLGLPKRKFTGAHYFKYRDKINVGCILLTKTDYEFSNLMNPCDIKHGAIYVGNIKGDEVKYVLEAIGSGVVLTDLVTFLTSKDRVVCVEYKNALKYSYSSLHVFVNLVLGTPYDYLFNPDAKAFYCFELCADFIREMFPNVKLTSREIIKNKYVYDHNTFLENESFRLIFDSRA